MSYKEYVVSNPLYTSTSSILQLHFTDRRITINK